MVLRWTAVALVLGCLGVLAGPAQAARNDLSTRIEVVVVLLTVDLSHRQADGRLRDVHCRRVSSPGRNPWLCRFTSVLQDAPSADPRRVRGKVWLIGRQVRYRFTVVGGAGEREVWAGVFG